MARDRLAGNVKNIAIVLNNFLVADKVLPPKQREWGYQKAYEMVKKAIEYAGSHYTRQKFTKDEELIKRNMEVERTNRSYYEQANPKRSSASSTVYTPTAKPAIGINWKPLIGWAVFIGFIIVIGYLRNNASNDTSAKRSSYSNRSASSSTNLYQLKARIESLAQTIRVKEVKLRDLESRITPGINRLKALESEINALDSQLQKTWFDRDRLIDEYNQQVDRYNAMLASYKNIYSEYQTLYNSYKHDISTHDSLVESYNSQIR